MHDAFSSLALCVEFGKAVSNKVASKLQAVLRANPKKARPSCRKDHKEKAATKSEQKIKIEQTELPVVSLAPDREVWEVSDDSDVEVLVVERLCPMAASELAVPDVSSKQINGRAHAFLCLCMHA